MNVLSIKDLTLNYFGHEDSLNCISHEFTSGINVLFGVQGAGKTSLLKAICGLAKPSKGDILFNGEKLLLGKDNDIAVVFDDLALFEKRSLKYNLFYPLKIRKTPLDKAEALVQKGCQAFELTPYLFSVKAFRLAPDERVKAALVRAFYRNPKLIILDNPLGRLSPSDRQIVFTMLFRELSKTDAVVIYATDDPKEVMSLCAPTLVLSYGYGTETGLPSDFRFAPQCLYTARTLLPYFNVFPAVIKNGVVSWAFGEQSIDLHDTLAQSYLDSEVLLGFCPDAVISGECKVSLTTELQTEQGFVYLLEKDGAILYSNCLSEGISLCAEKIFLFDKNNERTIYGRKSVTE